jgi:hypothetical protein
VDEVTFDASDANVRAKGFDEVLERRWPYSAPTHHKEQGWSGRFKYFFLICSRSSRARKTSASDAMTGTSRLGSPTNALALDGGG